MVSILPNARRSQSPPLQPAWSNRRLDSALFKGRRQAFSQPLMIGTGEWRVRKVVLQLASTVTAVDGTELYDQRQDRGHWVFH